MKKDTLNREANEFYEDVEKDFRNLISRLFFYLLTNGYTWEAIDGEVYHLYYDDFNITGVFFREEDFEDEVKDSLRIVAESLGYVITGSDYSGIDITIPLDVKGSLTDAQEQYAMHLQNVKMLEEVLLEKAAQFVKGINTIIKTSNYMSNLIKKGEIKLLLNYDISQSPGFFLDITAKFLHDYWIKETKANECSVEIGVNKNGENWISIKIKK